MDTALQQQQQQQQQPQKGDPIIINERLRGALSPQSGLYTMLWPIIIQHTEYRHRRHSLLKVNRYLRYLCQKHHEHSDKAKTVYESWSTKYPNLDYTNLDHGELLARGEWRYLKTTMLRFPDNVARDEFLASGTLDPTTKITEWVVPVLQTWSSSEPADVVLVATFSFHSDTFLNLEVVGRKRKVEAMFRFLEMKFKESTTESSEESGYARKSAEQWYEFVLFGILEFEGKEVEGVLEA